MPKLQIKTEQEIQRDIINAVVARTDLSDLTATATLRHFIGAVSSSIASTYYQFTRLADLFDIQRAAGTDLDKRATEILGGTIERRGARRAVGQLTFSREVAMTAPVSIPAGALVKTTGGTTAESTEDGTILAGDQSVVVDARMQEPGAVGNVGPTTLTVFQSKPVGVDSVTNASSFTQGADLESDDAFRGRILEMVESLARSTPDALEFVVKGIEDPGGSGKQITFAHTYEDPQAPGTAIIYVDDGTGAVATTAPSESLNNKWNLAGVLGITLSASVGGTQTLTSGSILPGYVNSMVGQYITLWGPGSLAPENVGSFLITAVISSSELQFTNPGGLAEGPVFTASYVIGELVTLGVAGPIVNTTVGGEEFLGVANYPLVAATEQIVEIDTTASGALGAGFTQLSRDVGGGLSASGGPADYAINWANGRIFFLSPRAAGRTILATYTHYTGAIQEAQKVVDGDPNDRLNYPGWRAAGVNVRVIPPTIDQKSVTAYLTITRGYERSAVITNAEAAVSNYINNLGISGDVIRSEVIEQLMGVDGVYDVNLIAPAGNEKALDWELPRINAANIDIQ